MHVSNMKLEDNNLWIKEAIEALNSLKNAPWQQPISKTGKIAHTLKLTSYPNFSFTIICDGSLDRGVEIVFRMKMPQRLSLIEITQILSIKNLIASTMQAKNVILKNEKDIDFTKL